MEQTNGEIEEFCETNLKVLFSIYVDDFCIQPREPAVRNAYIRRSSAGYPPSGPRVPEADSLVAKCWLGMAILSFSMVENIQEKKTLGEIINFHITSTIAPPPTLLYAYVNRQC